MPVFSLLLQRLASTLSDVALAPAAAGSSKEKTGIIPGGTGDDDLIDSLLRQFCGHQSKLEPELQGILNQALIGVPEKMHNAAGSRNATDEAQAAQAAQAPPLPPPIPTASPDAAAGQPLQ